MIEPPYDAGQTFHLASNFVIEAALQLGCAFVPDSESGAQDWEAKFWFGHTSGALVFVTNETSSQYPPLFFFRTDASGSYPPLSPLTAALRASIRALWSGVRPWDTQSEAWQKWLIHFALSSGRLPGLPKAELAGEILLDFRKNRHLKKFAQAEDQLQLARSVWPELSTPREWELWLKAVRGKTEEALIGLDRLPPEYASEPLRRATYALCMLHNNHPEAALDILEAVPAVDPFHRELNLVAAQTLVALGRTEDAQRVLEDRVFPCVLLPELTQRTYKLAKGEN